MTRYLWLAAGHVALAVGVVGLFLPVLPTTPFLIVAAYCYGRGSKRFEAWLLGNPRLGPLIRDWRQHGVIPPRAKILASIMIGLSIAYVQTRQTVPLPAKIGMLAVTLPALGYILSRPSRPC
jgi:uncharacterized membrane protein YbaN (DUF454 family)